MPVFHCVCVCVWPCASLDYSYWRHLQFWIASGSNDCWACVKPVRVACMPLVSVLLSLSGMLSSSFNAAVGFWLVPCLCVYSGPASCFHYSPFVVRMRASSHKQSLYTRTFTHDSLQFTHVYTHTCFICNSNVYSQCRFSCIVRISFLSCSHFFLD